MEEVGAKILSTADQCNMEPNQRENFCLFEKKMIKLNPPIPRLIHLGISVQGQDLLLRVQQLASICNIDSRLLFVARQHPNLQAGLAQGSDGFRDTVLEPVLDARRS